MRPNARSSTVTSGVARAAATVRGAIRPNVEGAAWLVVSVVLLWQGWVRGVNLISLVACVMIALWLLNAVWILARFGLKRLAVRRRTDPHIFAGRATDIDLEISNPRRRSQPGLRIDDVGRSHANRLFLPLLGGEEYTRKRFRVVFPNRGLYRWPSVRISTAYPFGLLRRSVVFHTQEESIILPRLGRLQLREFRRLLKQRVEPLHSRKPPLRKHLASQNEFHSLREYRPGDSYRWIHWRTTARVNELMVRQFAEPPVENLTVIVDPSLPMPPMTTRRGQRVPILDDPDYQAEADNLEMAIRLAATICWEWHRQPEALVALAIADGATPVCFADAQRGQIFQILETLALVQGGPPRDQEKTLNKLATANLPPGPCVLVTARTTNWTTRIESGMPRPMLVLDASSGGFGELFDPNAVPRGMIDASAPSATRKAPEAVPTHAHTLGQPRGRQ